MRKAIAILPVVSAIYPIIFYLNILLLFYHQFAQNRQELFYLAALHLVIIEVYIIEEVISLVFGHITTITASDDCYGG